MGTFVVIFLEKCISSNFVAGVLEGQVTQLVRVLGGGNLDEHGTKLLSTFVVIFLEKCISSNFGVGVLEGQVTQLVRVLGKFYLLSEICPGGIGLSTCMVNKFR